jgi:hypothetical protein
VQGSKKGKKKNVKFENESEDEEEEVKQNLSKTEITQQHKLAEIMMFKQSLNTSKPHFQQFAKDF